MVAVAVQQFDGAMPYRDTRTLPENIATAAVNLRTGNGALEQVRQPRLLSAMLASTRAVYRIPTGDPANLDASYWMQFTDPDTDVFRTPVVNDFYERYYWASPSTGLKYATKAEILNNGSAAGINTGVPRPATAPTLSVVAGTGGVDENGDPSGVRVTRAYIVTFVSLYGEEGAPSPAAETIGYHDQDWFLRDIPQPVTDVGNTQVVKLRVYRTVTGISGTTEFYLVVELGLGTLAYVDRLSDVQVTGNNILDSTNADTPPQMTGLALMPNGIFVGFFGNNLYFSDNFKPHSWPAAYSLTVQFPIVALAVMGSTCLVLTTGNPAAVTGNQGGTMTLTAMDTPMPCLSRQSVVVAPEGIYWASSDGIAVWSPGGLSVASKDVIPRDNWRNEYDPGTLEGTLVNGVYTGIRQTGGGAETQFTFPGQGTVIEFDGTANWAGGRTRLHLDMWSGRALYLSGGNLYEWFPPNTAMKQVRWRSKEFQTPVPVNLGAGIIYGDTASDENVALRLWAAGVLVFDQFVPLNRVFRMPTGFKCDIWQFELVTNNRVRKVLLGQTVSDLKRG